MRALRSNLVHAISKVRLQIKTNLSIRSSIHSSKLYVLSEQNFDKNRQLKKRYYQMWQAEKGGNKNAIMLEPSWNAVFNIELD